MMIESIYNDIVIPDADVINYSDAEEVCGYQMLLCKLYEACGGFSYPRVTNTNIRFIESQGRVWLGNVKNRIDGIVESKTSALTLADIPGLLASYDFLYRICNGTPCCDYLKRIRLAAVQRWLNGDKSISSTDVALMIADEMKRDMRGLDGRYSTYYFRTEEQWVDELACHGRFMNLPLREVYDRLRLLLNQDLFAYLNSKEQQRFKRKWVETNKLTDLSTIDIPAHWAYIGFIRTATHLGYNECEDEQSQYFQLLSILASRPDLHPFYKDAIRIEIERYAMYA